MSFRTNSADHQKSGFTLIELLVVVLILGALAAIVIPRFINVEKMAEKNAASTNLGQVNEIINAHMTLTGKIPDGLDLLNDTGLLPELPEGIVGTIIDETPANLSSDEVTALQNLGLEMVFKGGQENVSLTTGDKVYKVASDDQVFIGGNLQSIQGCYIFGLGDHIRPWEKYEASVSFEKPGTYPGIDQTLYRNYLLVVDLTDTDAPKYVGCIDPLFEGKVQ